MKPIWLRPFLMITFIISIQTLSHSTQIQPKVLLYYTVRPIKGEKCLVSGKEIDPKRDIVIQINNKRVPLNRENILPFLKNLKSYLRKAKPASPYSIKIKRHRFKYIISHVIPGEICIISGNILGKDDVCLLINGRRVSFKKQGLKIFLQNPEKYISKLRPSGANFDEWNMNTRPMSNIWLYLGLYGLFILIFGALTASIAIKKNLQPAKWFMLGILFHIIALVVLLTKKEGISPSTGNNKMVQKSQSPIACQECGFENHPSARQCFNCGEMLAPVRKSEVDRLAELKK